MALNLSSEFPHPISQYNITFCDTLGKSDKPLFFAFGILVGLGLVLIGMGLASFGHHQQWWSAGLLGKGTVVNGIMMMATGGISLVIAIGLIVAKALKKPTVNEVLEKVMPSGTYTFVLQPNGNYLAIIKHSAENGGQLEIKGAIAPKAARFVHHGYPDLLARDGYDYRYIETSELPPVNSPAQPPPPQQVEHNPPRPQAGNQNMIDAAMLPQEVMDGLDQQLVPRSFTFVLQADGNYATVFKADEEGGNRLGMGRVARTDQLAAARRTIEIGLYRFIETSPIPPGIFPS